MKKWMLGILGAITVIVLIGVVFLLGRVTGTPSADAADTTPSTSQPASTTTSEPEPTTTTSAPATGDAVAVAGDDLIVSAGEDVTLDGTGSSDPDDQDLDYTWTQTYGPDVTEGDGALTGDQPTFTAPGDVSTLVFDLTVGDGAESEADAVMIQVVEDAATAVFVDAGADVSGVGRGTMEEPFNTIAAGIAVAKDRGGVDIYLKRLAERAYVVEDTLEVPSNVSLYGGYGDDWLRDATEPTAINGPAEAAVFVVDGLHTVVSGLAVSASTTRGTAVALQFLTDDIDGGSVRIEDSIILGGDGRQSYGAIAEGTFDLTVVRTSIAGGAGGTGADGSKGTAQDGAAAVAGGNADERDPGGGYNPGGEGGSALAGKGKKGIGNPSTLGGNGGDAGEDGDDGDQLGGVGGGVGGAGGTHELWQGEGTPGSDGFHGREGGGGGGGGGKIGLEGGGGGGGGEGGKPGLGGDGGSRGGESIGLYVDVAGTVLIEDSTLSGGRGGDGGDGGMGSFGLPGANAGRGEPGSCSFFGCGAGQAGGGGDGRGGGAGSQGGQGGGGAGGPSIGFMVDSDDAVVSMAGCKILGSTGGNGGQGGLGGLSAEGSSGRTSGKNPVPGSEATAALPGSDGGSSFGLVYGDGTSADQVTNEDCQIDGGRPGSPGDAPIPGNPGLSAETNG